MYCPNCGAKVSGQDKFCSDCGYELNNEKKGSISEPQKTEYSEQKEGEEKSSVSDDETKKSYEQLCERVRFAGFWKRFIALILDAIVVGAPLFLISALIFVLLFPSDVTSNGLNVVHSIFYFFLYSLVVIIYWVKNKGQTPGKSIMDIKIVCLDKKSQEVKNISFGKAILRFFIGYSISSLLFYIGFIMAGFHSEKRGLHDLISNTYVIEKEEPSLSFFRKILLLFK